MTEVAGIFLINNDNHILVCHPTKHSPNFWSIPKGRVDDGETILAAAIRETHEEANINVEKWDFIHSLRSVKYDKKTLNCFAVFERENGVDFSKFDLKCNSNVEESKGGYPEMDDFKWVTVEEAKKILHGPQTQVFNELEPLMNRIATSKRRFIIKK